MISKISELFYCCFLFLLSHVMCWWNTSILFPLLCSVLSCFVSEFLMKKSCVLKVNVKVQFNYTVPALLTSSKFGYLVNWLAHGHRYWFAYFSKRLTWNKINTNNQDFNETLPTQRELEKCVSVYHLFSIYILSSLSHWISKEALKFLLDYLLFRHLRSNLTQISEHRRRNLPVAPDFNCNSSTVSLHFNIFALLIPLSISDLYLHT